MGEEGRGCAADYGGAAQSSESLNGERERERRGGGQQRSDPNADECVGVEKLVFEREKSRGSEC